MIPFPCHILDLSELRGGWIHLHTMKSAPLICCVSVRILDSLAERNFTARSQTFFIFLLRSNSVNLVSGG